MLYLFDLVGVAVFAFSGALAAGRFGLDLLGVVVIATVTAIGGGTLRDVLLSRHPIFWIRDQTYVIVIAITALLTTIYARHFPLPGDSLQIADALGLGLFAITGAQAAESLKIPRIIVIVMGTMTGVAGGMVRDVLTNQIPMVLRGDFYATAAIAGIALYLVLKALGVRPSWAFGAGFVAISGLRLAAIFWGWSLPVFRLGS
ncbi:MAG: trimeric intracellular cation channel family protein [Burkholderiales bacterium]|nr:trimeric intracellular cation channel family protein [Burkholderiales bacterium]